MLTADFTIGAGRLRKATQALHLSWDDAQQNWKDAKSRAFEEKYLQELTPKIKESLDATGRLAELIARAQRECEG